MPERIGAYRLESPLGRGGMGEVFLAWDERLERPVAIKRIRHDAFVLGHQRERFRREARLAARLSHASIVQVHDLVMEESGDAIVMEYIEGPTLAERLTRGPLGTVEAVRLAREIAEGLAAAHEAGLIHRDLKAENVVITPSGHAKILDFGLARLVSWDGEMLTQQNALIGTCYAMSPEQARGGELDERSDLFSFGALLYEMLTGRSAFRAKNPLATLEKVLHDQPPPLAQVRPDLPEDLVALVERLLAKDRAGRPKSAGRVARKLERIERELPAEELPGPNDDSVSEMPTQAFPALPFARSATAAPRSASAATGPVPRTRSWILVLAGALGALVIAVAASYLLSRTPAVPSGPLRVVPYTDISNHAGLSSEHLDKAATSILSAAISGLSSLEGIAPIDPSIGSRPGASPQEIARAFAAEEILLVRLEFGEDSGTVTLRRLTSDGTVLWNGEPFRVYISPDELSLLAIAVDTRIQRAYSDHRPRPGAPKLEVRDPDYAAFLSFMGKVNHGNTLDKPDLARLREIIRNSPRFLDALILASESYRSLFQSTRSPSDRDLAVEYARQAQALSSTDPRPVISHFKIALEGSNLKEAEKDLKRIEELMLGDPQLLVYQAKLAARQGLTGKAIADLRHAVKQAPSWRNLFDLADLEAGVGKVTDARQHLHELLSRSPDNQWGLAKLAEIELQYGDIARAEGLYWNLAATDPRRSYFSNLGLARSLLRRDSEAVEAYQKALEIDPGHVVVMLNLAEAKLALGHKAEAGRLLRETLQRIEERRKEAALSATDSMIQAQCLARLGRIREAVMITQQTLEKGADNSQVRYMAALVYSLVGNRDAALVNAQAALEKGFRTEWFALPAFGPLREDPELRAMLRKAAATGPS